MNYAEIRSKYPKAWKAFDEWIYDYPAIWDGDYPMIKRLTREYEFEDVVPFEMQIGVLCRFLLEKDVKVWVHPGRYAKDWSVTVSPAWTSNSGVDGCTDPNDAYTEGFEIAFDAIESQLLIKK